MILPNGDMMSKSCYTDVDATSSDRIDVDKMPCACWDNQLRHRTTGEAEDLNIIQEKNPGCGVRYPNGHLLD